MKNIPVLALLLLFSIPSFGQFEKIIHQSFELNETTALNFEILGEYEVIPWEGNVVLTETKVQLHDASPSIFNFYLEKERYNLKGDEDGKSFVLGSVDSVRKPIRTKKGECFEFVNVRVFVPNDYVKVGENKWRLSKIKNQEVMAKNIDEPINEEENSNQ